MNELVDLIVKKTGVPAATATTIVNIVLNYATKKLPAPIATELTALLNNDAVVSEAESLVGGLAAEIEKSAAAKKKK
jgi:hypothetical protein